MGCIRIKFYIQVYHLTVSVDVPMLGSKNQLSQINSPTTMGCSLECSIAKSTMVQLLSLQNYVLLLWMKHTIYF